MNVKLNISLLKEIVKELNEKIVNNFITNVTVINSSDVVFAFSFSKKRLLISLNHNSPFISLLDSISNYKTTLGSMNDNLRKYLKGSYITNVEILNNDRIVKFSLVRNNDFYQKEKYSLILELIPTINNLILIDELNKVIFAKHYADLSSSRPIIKGFEYTLLENKKPLSEQPFDYKKYQEDVYSYLLDIENKTKKENAQPLYNHLLSKKKSLIKKVKVLENEVENAKKNLTYKEIGETLLTLQNDVENLKSYILSILDTYDKNKSVMENANKYFEKYKKNKRTIENDIREIEIAKRQILDLSNILDIFQYLSDSEINELYLKYLPKSIKDPKHKIVVSNLPYFIEYKGVKIGFGKNKEQNNYLTFKLARKDDYFLHAKDHSGAHVVIFNNDPEKEIILLASEIALILSNLESGDIYLADIKDVKKANSIGEVNLLKYQTITLKSVREETKLLLKEQRRFN